MRYKFIIPILFVLSSVMIAQTTPYTYRLNSEDAALGKTNSSNPLSNTVIDIIAIGDTIWLGTSRGVSLSVDNGVNWTNFYGRSDFGTPSICAIGYDKYTRTFWCATAKSTEVTGGQVLPEGTGLKYTTDFGNTWSSVPQPVDHPDSTTIQYGINTLPALPVTVTIQNLTYDIAFTPGTVWITSFAGGLRKSTDKGLTWSRVVLPSDSLNSISPTDTLNFCVSPSTGNFCVQGNLNHRAFSVISVDDYTLYVGTANGINKSTDNGISWVKFNAQNQDQPISGNFITSLNYNTNNHTIWASTWKAESQSEFYAVSSSNDGGLTWKTFLNDERGHNVGFKNFDVMIPTDNGVFRTTDNGATWLLPNSIVDAGSNSSLKTKVFYAATSYQNNIWLGSVDGLVRLKETTGKVWEGNWKIYFASTPLTAKDETYCYPNPFSPRQEQLKIRYSTSGSSANVTIRIYDFAFNYIRTIVQNVSRNLDLEGSPEFWDGKDDNGNYVPNGVYFYRIDIGDDNALFGKVMVLQ